MDIPTRSHDWFTILDLSGHIDANTAADIKKRLEQPAANRLLVNLAAVDFIDSSGLSILIGVMKRCRQNGGDLRLCNLQPPVRIIFELTKLDRAFVIFADEQEALAACAG